ncbi:MAG: carboxymuconolactone decarboxylase family protein [Alphaproteobacteria bacterium]|nr:carboxymuconolactone decarboxylase family protein [Alphaproteobacteria bacterium]
MTRLSYIECDDADPRLRPIYDAILAYGPFANQVRTMAHCPPVLEHIMALLFAWRETTCLSRRNIELLNVVVAKRNRCDYCLAHHEPVLAIEGMSEEGVARLPDHENHPELDEDDRLVVRYALQVNDAPTRITDRLFDQLRQRFSEAAIAELTWRIGLAGAFNRINQALGIEIESDLVQAGEARIGGAGDR